MNKVNFIKDEIIDSIYDFRDILSLKRKKIKDLINKNNILDTNFDIKLYNFKIFHFSKLKYIENNLKLIEDAISNTEQISKCDIKFYKNKINTIRNIPLELLSKIEESNFRFMISIKNAILNNNIDLASDEFKKYSLNLKELSDVIISNFNFYSNDKNLHESRYQAFALFQDRNFSSYEFENFLASISSELSQLSLNLTNNYKCIKFHKPDTNLLKSNEFQSIINSFFAEIFKFDKYFENKNYSKYLIYEDITDFSDEIFSKNDLSIKDILIYRMKTYLKNLKLNLFNKDLNHDQKFNINLLFEGFDKIENYYMVDDFFCNFLINSQYFIESFANYIKKSAKIKGKIFEQKNLFWLINSIFSDESNSLIKFSNLKYNELGYIFIEMSRYVIERDFINNIEKLNLRDLSLAWVAAFKKYFNQDVSEIHFLENFNFDISSLGLSSFNILKILKSSEIYNKIISCNECSENKINYPDEALDRIVEFNDDTIFYSEEYKKDINFQNLFLEYKKYFKNKFGIDL